MREVDMSQSNEIALAAKDLEAAIKNRDACSEVAERMEAASEKAIGDVVVASRVVREARNHLLELCGDDASRF
jgi:hypothetical protein